MENYTLIMYNESSILHKATQFRISYLYSLLVKCGVYLSLT